MKRENEMTPKALSLMEELANTLPMYEVQTYDVRSPDFSKLYNDIKVGDILRIQNESYTVIGIDKNLMAIAWTLSLIGTDETKYSSYGYIPTSGIGRFKEIELD